MSIRLQYPFVTGRWVIIIIFINPTAVVDPSRNEILYFHWFHIILHFLNKKWFHEAFLSLTFHSHPHNLSSIGVCSLVDKVYLSYSSACLSIHVWSPIMSSVYKISSCEFFHLLVGIHIRQTGAPAMWNHWDTYFFTYSIDPTWVDLLFNGIIQGLTPVLVT